jgi:tRNA(Ile)-lysidine synthase
LSRSAAHIAQSCEWVDERVQRDLIDTRDGEAISLPLMRRLPPERQLELLRAFVEAAGLRPPPHLKLREAVRQMLQAGPDKIPAIRWAEHALRRYRERIYLTDARILPIAERRWDFRAAGVCELGLGHGRLRVQAFAGGLDPRRLPAVLNIRSRRGGESLKHDAEAPTRSVRHLFQVRGVLPWMRDAVPFIHGDDSLLAVADLWTESRYRCECSRTGIAFNWESAPTIC